MELSGILTVQALCVFSCMQLTSKYNNASSITNMLEDVGLRNLEQCRIDSQLTTLFKITWGILSVNSNRLLHPVTHRTCHSD